MADITLLPDFTFQPELPAVFDDSLSYLQMLSRLLAKVNELTTAVNNVDIDAINQKLADLKTYIDTQDSTLQGNINTLSASVTSQINTLYTYVNGKFDTINIEITALGNRITGLQDSIQAEIQQAIKSYDSYIKTYIANQVLEAKVVNYFTGDKISIQDMFDYLARLHITNGLTYAQIAERGYTYQEIIDKCTAGNYTYADLTRDANTILPVK